MAALNVSTVAEILPLTATVKQALAAEAIVRGKLIRIAQASADGTIGSAYLADCNEQAGAVHGIAMSDVAAGQWLSYALPGATVRLGATCDPDKVAYYLGDDGSIVPVADIVGGDYITYVGVGDGTDDLAFHVHATGITA